MVTEQELKELGWGEGVYFKETVPREDVKGVFFEMKKGDWFYNLIFNFNKQEHFSIRGYNKFTNELVDEHIMLPVTVENLKKAQDKYIK